MEPGSHQGTLTPIQRAIPLVQILLIWMMMKERCWPKPVHGWPTPKKAKRKAREAQLEEARRLASLQKTRELKAAGLATGRSEKKRRGINHQAEIAFDLGAVQGPIDANEYVVTAKDGMSGFQPRSGQDRSQSRSMMAEKMLTQGNRDASLHGCVHVNVHCCFCCSTSVRPSCA
jgi:hypothetical protein